MKLDLGCGKTPLEGYVGVDLPLDSRPRLDGLWGPDTRGGFHLRGEESPAIDSKGIIRFDLASGRPWPFADDSIDALFSSHLIEHIPASDVYTYEYRVWNDREPTAAGSPTPNGKGLYCSGSKDALLRFMDEAWRVAKPGGEFLLRWPALRDERTGKLLLGAYIDPTHRRFIPREQIHYWSRRGRKAFGVEQYPAVCNWVVKTFSQRELSSSLGIIENEVLLIKEL